MDAGEILRFMMLNRKDMSYVARFRTVCLAPEKNALLLWTATLSSGRKEALLRL
jgi:hypothetical protein